MKKIEQFINDPLFVNWIFNSNPQLDNHWEEYFSHHPEETFELLEIKEKFRSIKVKSTLLSEKEKLDLAISIYKKIQIEKRKRELLRKIGITFRYAAIAIFFFAAGGIFFYLTKTDKENFDQYISTIETPVSVTGPMLILSEGKSVALHSDESLLDYRNPGEIVLNKDSVIKEIIPSKINQLLMPHGNFSRLLLSDSSEVWLNAGSSLIYPSVFSDKNRQVVLFGEAYFNVAKNKIKPFIVRTTDLEIKVLGTEFNISAYPEDNFIHTVVKKGSVSIHRIKVKDDLSDIILKSNQLASFDKLTSQSSVSDVNTDFYTLWTDGLLCFENRDFNRVIKALERYYDINCQFEDGMLGVVKISGKLDLNQGREEVFEYLSKVTSATFEQIDENYYRIK